MNPTSYTMQSFANSVRASAPNGIASDGRAYKDIPDNELTQKIVQANPVYQKQISDYSDTPIKPASVKTTPPATFAESPIGKYTTSVLDAGAKPQQDAARNIMATLGDPNKNTISKGVDVAGDIAGGIVNTFGGILNSAVIKPLGDAFGSMPIVQQLAESKPIATFLKNNEENAKFLADKWTQVKTEHPDVAKKVEDGGNIAQFMTLFIGDDSKFRDTITSGAEDLKNNAIDIGNKTIDKANQGASAIINKADEVGKKLPIGNKTPVQADNAVYDQKLQNAYESIYTKLKPSEKASIQLKDIGSGFTKKSVPDFISDPKTKPVVESVANLPEDIQLKPGDTLTERQSKLDQGAKRLHIETDGMLADPKIKAQTSFNEARFNKYMADNVLKSVGSEFGVDSVEYRATQKAIDTARKSIESKDAHGVYTGRQKFSSIWESENPRTFKKANGSMGSELDPQTTATVEAGRDVYNALNDFNESLLPENHPLRSRMKEESNLIRAKEEMRTRGASEVGKNDYDRFMDRNPVIKGAKNVTKKAIPFGIGTHL